MGKYSDASLTFGDADCPTCGWKMNGVGYGKNAMAVAANHAKATGHTATARLEYYIRPKQQPKAGA